MSIPEKLLYTKDHEWVKIEDDIAIIGITSHAQDQLGDIVFLELPDTGSEFSAGDSLGVVESVKAVSDIYCPLSGEIIETNEEAISEPSVINQDPFGDAWLFQIKISDKDEIDDLLNASDYEKLTEED